MTDKIVRINYKRDGVELETNHLTNDELEQAQSLFDDGLRDPSKIRDAIGFE